MKKRIFSMLLMGAMVVASMSMFTSCKDYDDDINKNANDISALKTQLASLQTALETAKSEAATAHATYATKQELSDKADALAAALALTDAANDEAINANAASIKANQAAIDALKTDLAAYAKVSALEQVKADLEKAIADAQVGKVTTEELKETLMPISAKIDAIDESINTLTKDVAALKEWKATAEGQIAALLEDMKSQKELVAQLQEELKKKANKDELAGLISEEAVKKYLEEYLKTTGIMQSIDTKIADALKAYKTSEELDKILSEYAKSASVTAEIKKTLEDYYTVAKVDSKIADVNATINNKATELLAKIGEVSDAVKQTNEDLKTAIANTKTAYEAAIAASEGKTQTAYNEAIAASEAKTKTAYDEAIKTAVAAAVENAVSQAKALDVTKEEIEKIAQTAADKVSTSLGDNMNTLNLFVNKMLTSVTLIPQLYLNGIEAIQFKSVYYIPQIKDYKNISPLTYADAVGTDGTTTWAANQTITLITEGSTPIWATWKAWNTDHQLVNTLDAKKNPVTIRIDNGETEAYYRLSPTQVKQEDIDVDNILFTCTTAATETRAATLKVNNPVKPTFKKLESGVMTVSLSKTTTNSLYYNGEDNGKTDVIASLMVPRKANAEKKIEYAEIYSEFNLIDEALIYPRIAALNKTKAGYVYDDADHDKAPQNALPMKYHFIDSLHIYRSQVDKNIYVKEEIQYDKPFDLLQLVTGCYETFNPSTLIGDGSHAEITKAELAKYGIAFRFYVPSKEYGDDGLTNYNFTNQQVFAKIENNHIISATLPSGKSALGNRAIIGKEPIVRVEMVDTVRNNLIDMAYFKVKFVDTTPAKPAIDVEMSGEQTLSCGTNSMIIKWDKFIEEVYAKMEGTYGTGLSWKEFCAVYPAADVVRGKNKFVVATGGTGSATWAREGTIGGGSGLVNIYWLSGNASTESPTADANELWWSLGAADIKTILPAREKTYSTTVTFVSNRPTDYGNINLKLNFKIKMPDAPALTYYSNYWYDQYNSHYVLPVQYNTKAYYDQLIGKTADNAQYNPANINPANTYTDEQANAGAYCVYNNNLFNAFTFNQDKTSPYYNTPIPSIAGYGCATWDFQFRLAQPDAGVNAHPQYWTATATEPLTTTGIAGTYTIGTDYLPNLSVKNVNGAAFGAYNLLTEESKAYSDAIWMNWYDDEKTTNGGKDPGTVTSKDGSWAWNNTDGGSRPYLFADHYNKNNQLLINPITSNGIGEAPTFSNSKKVTMGMFLAWNSWNIELIKTYTICLVAPIDINASLKGYFEEGLVSGSFVNCAGAFTMVDFRGYEVRENAHTAAELTKLGSKAEFYKYCDRLYDYYECQTPVFDLTKIKYGMKYENGNVVVDNTVTIDNINSKGLTSAQINQYTNGNVVLSIEQIDPTDAPNTQWLRFKNNGGSNVEEEVNVFIPATMTYGFGSVTKYVQIKLYPRGKVPAGA